MGHPFFCANALIAAKKIESNLGLDKRADLGVRRPHADFRSGELSPEHAAA